MPACGEGDGCKDKSLPCDGRHGCALCEVELHGICGFFYNEDSIKFQNICTKCKVEVDRKNHDLMIHGLPPLPCPLLREEVAQFLPSVMNRMATQAPILPQPPHPACPPIVPRQGPKASSKKIVVVPLHSKKKQQRYYY